MREKYIFFILLVIVLVMVIGGRVNKRTECQISCEEEAINERLKQETEQSVRAQVAEKIDMDKIQEVVPFSHYEGMLERSPFFKVQPKQAEPTTKPKVMPVEDKTPKFVYKGKISARGRQVIIIKQTRSGEVFMVSKGENLDGYKVLDITDTEVILSKKGEEDIVLKTTEKP